MYSLLIDSSDAVRRAFAADERATAPTVMPPPEHSSELAAAELAAKEGAIGRPHGRRHALRKVQRKGIDIIAHRRIALLAREKGKDVGNGLHLTTHDGVALPGERVKS
jgi:hypothetical protein